MLILGIIGIVLAVCSFIFLVLNMTVLKDGSNTFRNHGLGMIGFFLGGVMGTVCLLVHFAPLAKKEVIEVIREVKK